MHMIPKTEKTAQNWIGKTIRTTDSRTGQVEAAHVDSNVVYLHVRGEFGDFFNTDNEHATIVREA